MRNLIYIKRQNVFFFFESTTTAVHCVYNIIGKTTVTQSAFLKDIMEM